MSIINPCQVGPPSREFGYLPSLPMPISRICLGISRASLIHMPVISKERSFLTSFGLSRALNRNSI